MAGNYQVIGFVGIPYWQGPKQGRLGDTFATAAECFEFCNSAQADYEPGVKLNHPYADGIRAAGSFENYLDRLGVIAFREAVALGLVRDEGLVFNRRCRIPGAI